MTLSAIESNAIPLPDHLVTFDTSPAAIVKNEGLLLRAFDPYLPVVPRLLLPWHQLLNSPEAANPAWWLTMIGEPAEILMQAAQKLDAMLGRTANMMMSEKLSSDSIAVLATQLPFAARLQRSVLRLSAQPSAAAALEALIDGDGWVRDGLISPPRLAAKDEPDDIADRINEHARVTRGLMQLTLWLKTTQILTSEWLVGDITAPVGVQKETFATVTRTSRFGTMMYWLADQMQLFHLREEARFLQQPVIQALLLGLAPHARDELTERSTHVLAEAMHPYLARAERVLLPARRYSRFGTANMTMGLSRGGLWRKVSAAAVATEGMKTSRVDLIDMARKLVEGDGVAAGVLKRLRERAQTMSTLDQPSLATARALCGAVSPGGPANFQLFGQAYAPMITDGLGSTRGPTDVLDLMTLDVLRLGTTGQPDAFSASLSIGLKRGYDPSSPDGRRLATISGSSSWKDLNALTTQGPLFMAPDVPEMSSSYALSILTTSMIRPFNDAEYFGDHDAVVIPNTDLSLALALGLEDADVLKPDFVTATMHLRDADRKLRAGQAFYSSRTKQPWLQRLVLVQDARPTTMLAVSDKAGAAMTGVEALVNLTPERTTVVSDLEPTLLDGARGAALR